LNVYFKILYPKQMNTGY